MAYPTSLDALTNPISTDTLAEVPHADQHADANDAIEAIETKLGTGASTPTTAGDVLKVTGAGATAYGAITAADVSAAPDDVDYLVGTASGNLSGEIAVGTAPGGELGGTWASPTVDATHSGSTHAATQAAAEATASSALSAHVAAADPHTGYQKESEKAAASGYASLDSGTKVPVAQIRSLNAGTSFPVSPSTNDYFTRTDRGITYYYDGTRWLCECPHTFLGTGLVAATVTTATGRVFVPQAYNLWLEKVTFGNRVITTNNGTSFWTQTLRKVSLDGGTDTAIASRATSSDTAGQFVAADTTIGEVLTVASTPLLYVNVVKTSSPGAIDSTALVHYRMIG